jgi:AcrR family transcriptional regulator
MPKIISDHERKRTQEAITKHTKMLVLEKRGVRDITIDDIVRSVGLGKGSFYTYFKSKEECLYQVLATAVTDVYEQIALIKSEKLSTKEKAAKFVREVYLSKERVDYYFTTTDIEALFRKLPPEYGEKEHDFIGAGLTTKIMKVMDIDRTQAEVFYTLLECIEFAANRTISEQAKAEAIDALVQLFAEYAGEHSTV